jgi:DNA-binding response OmpR family regulator
MAKTGHEETQPLVLVVDDDLMMRTLARGALERGGFRVEEARDGLEALSQFQRCQPSLVFLDVDMPKLDGFETCKQLRRLPTGETTPVLIITGLDDLESIHRAYDVGATDFTTKPVNWVILRHRARYMIRAGKAVEARVRSEQKARALLNAIPAMVFQIQRDGTVLDYKPVKGVDTFLRPEEFMGKTLFEILPANAAEHCLEYAEKALESGEEQRFAYSVSGGSGLTHYQGRIVLSGSDRVLGIVQDVGNSTNPVHSELN